MPLLISEEDIKYAERILFGKENVFDDERKTFIKNLELADLQAVPGSGKTTALLAKLLVLAKHQPFDEDNGILVISHTNTAIDLIQEKIGIHCPNLFRFPNFVGTIQSFVNTFLAFPYFEGKFKFRPDFVDDAYYRKVAEQRFNNYIFPRGYSRQDYNNTSYFIKGNTRKDKNPLSDYRFDFDNDGNVVLTNGLNGKPLTYQKPKARIDFTAEEKQRVKEILEKFKFGVWMQGRVIHYDDAYFLANYYLKNYLLAKDILRKRFSYVFVDEMQDMDIHQVGIIDKVFLDEKNPDHVLQRIGDKNQAIFSSDVKLEVIWNERPKVLHISGSLRLSKNIADGVTPFGLNPIQVSGNNQIATAKNIPKRIILYNDKNIEQALPLFHKTIKHYFEAGEFDGVKELKFMAAGWRAKSDEERKTVIKDFFPKYNSQKRRITVEHECFEDYLNPVSKLKFKSNVFVNAIYDALFHVLEIEKIIDQNSGLRYNKSRLNNRISESDNDLRNEFKTILIGISNAYLNGKIEDVKNSFLNLVRIILGFLKPEHQLSALSNAFIETKSNLKIGQPDDLDNSNQYSDAGISIEVGTVHSVKGETYTGMLYLETFYQGGYETERLIEQLKGVQFNDTKVRHKQSTKMMYVGFSRPTHLLCLAAHEDRIKGSEAALTANGWVIDNSLL